MCGIVGYATLEGVPGLDSGFLRRACAVISHRGPDGEGVWSDASVGLGHRRLSIIDLVSGDQPMSYANGRFWITFNGEIYNYRELRAELAAHGSEFRTSSDTEVILAAYARWGQDAPSRLRGIFAFAIWDRMARSLFLSRDHLGVKPLLYYDDPRRFVFSSELKGILAADDLPREPDPEGLADYLALGYALGSKTVLRNVKRLPPGASLTWKDGNIHVQAFWNLAALASSQDPAREAEAVAAYARALEFAVERQMVADVPVGAFLSGGIDSSSVAYHMRSTTPHRLQTFSMGFDEPSYSELEFAQRVASTLGTDHYQQRVKPDLESSLPDLVRAFDEPLGDTSIVPTYFVSRLARERVKVVLSGDGADECLAGYDTYVADRLQRIYRRIPSALHDHVFLPASRIVPSSRKKVSFNYKVKQFVAHAHHETERAHYGWRLLFDPEEWRPLLGHHARQYDPFDTYRAYYDEVPGAAWLNRCLYVDVKTWLANDILPKVDRASMAVGLEARVPFLDVDLVELTMGLSPALKMRGLKRKVVLKQAMRGKLPDFVLRRRKSGFNAPVADWLRGALRPMAEEKFRAPSGLVDVEHPGLQALWRSHLAGEDYGFRLFALLTLLLWEKEVLRAPVAVAETVTFEADRS